MRAPVVFALTLLASLSQAQFAGPQLPTTTSNVTWHTFESGSNSRVARGQMFVLNTENDFLRYWQTNQGGPVPGRYVNWGTEKLVAIHLGTRKSGGFSVAVGKVRRENNGVATITALERSPGRGESSTQAQTSPWTIIRIDRGAYNLSYSVTADNSPPQFIFPNGGSVIHAGGTTIAMGNPWWGGCGTWDDGGYDDIGLYEIDSPQALARFWTVSRGGRDGMPEDVNWQTERLVAVNLGRQSGRAAVTVKDLRVVNGIGYLQASARIRSAPGVETRPYALIKVNRVIGKLRVDWVREP